MKLEYNYFYKIFLIIIIITVLILIIKLEPYVEYEIYNFYNSNNFLNKYVKKNLFTPNEQIQIVEESNNYADKNGWTKSRHKNYPTTDNEITKFWNIYNMINDKISNKILPYIQKKYNIDKSKLELSEIFIVKYSFDGQNQLELHTDHSDFSFIVSLNTENIDYTGGGTYFYNSNETIKLPTGDCLIFSGKNKHKGNKIYSGQRLILTGFINYTDGLNYEKIFIYETKKKIYFGIILFILFILFYL